VSAFGGIYVFKDREVPDTFNLMADFSKGHSLRAELEHGEFTAYPRIDPRAQRDDHHGGARAVRGQDRLHHVRPERKVIDDAYRSKWGDKEFQIKVDEKPRWAHMQNFLDCVRSREKPTLDVDTAFRAQ